MRTQRHLPVVALVVIATSLAWWIDRDAPIGAPHLGSGANVHFVAVSPGAAGIGTERVSRGPADPERGPGIDARDTRRTDATQQTTQLELLRRWPAERGFREHQPTEAVVAQAREDAVRALNVEMVRQDELNARPPAQDAEWCRIQCEYNLIKLSAEIACIERGHFWLLDPGVSLPINAELYRDFADTWFIHMRPCRADERNVQMVIYVPFSDFPEIPRIKRRESEFLARQRLSASSK